MVENLPVNAGDVGSIPGSGGSLGEGNGHPLQYSCLGNPWTEGPGGLQSVGSQRIGPGLATKQHHQTHLMVRSLLCLLKGLCVPFKKHWYLILSPLDSDVISL